MFTTINILKLLNYACTIGFAKLNFICSFRNLGFSSHEEVELKCVLHSHGIGSFDRLAAVWLKLTSTKSRPSHMPMFEVVLYATGF